MEDINAKIMELAQQRGFEGVYFIAPEKSFLSEFTEYDCVLYLMYPYTPYESGYINAYYIASNKSYHAVKELEKELNDMDIPCKNVYMPAKRTAKNANLGKQGKNTLLHTKQFGSRIVLYTLLVNGAYPMIYNIDTPDICATCNLCTSVCPTHAITNNGFDEKKCIRYYMDTPPYPDFIKPYVTAYLGCERCMAVCPYNANILPVKPPQEYIDIMQPSRILSGDIKQAKLLFGQNVSRKRFCADATLIQENAKD